MHGGHVSSGPCAKKSGASCAPRGDLAAPEINFSAGFGQTPLRVWSQQVVYGGIGRWSGREGLGTVSQGRDEE